MSGLDTLRSLYKNAPLLNWLSKGCANSPRVIKLWAKFIAEQ